VTAKNALDSTPPAGASPLLEVERSCRAWLTVSAFIVEHDAARAQEKQTAFRGPIVESVAVAAGN